MGVCVCMGVCVYGCVYGVCVCVCVCMGVCVLCVCTRASGVCTHQVVFTL